MSMKRRIRLTSTLALSVVAGFMVAGTAMAAPESPKVANVPHQVSTVGVNANLPAPALRDGYGHDKDHHGDKKDHKDHDGYKKDHDGKKHDGYKHKKKHKKYKKPHGWVHAGDGSLAQQ
jgi:ABC-type Zn2+ transport system substrate-binding protein/surface adhesin